MGLKGVVSKLFGEPSIDWQKLKVRYPEVFVIIERSFEYPDPMTGKTRKHSDTLKVKAKNLDKYIPLGWKIKKVLWKKKK